MSRALGSLGLGVLLSPVLGHADGEAKKKKRKKKKKKKKASPVSPPAPAPQLSYECPGPPASNVLLPGQDRLAQRFTAGRTGTLRQVRFAIRKGGTPGDFVVQLLRVTGGIPGSGPSDVLASVTIPDTSVPSGDTTLVAILSGPQLTQGTDYAVAITRPGSNELNARLRLEQGHACAGLMYFAPGPGAFQANGGVDLVVSVLVE